MQCLVTHDEEEALSFADRLAVMQDGGIEQTGTPEEVYYCPATPFVADFLGKTNLIAGEAKGDYAETPLGRLRLDRRAEGRGRTLDSSGAFEDGCQDSRSQWEGRRGSDA